MGLRSRTKTVLQGSGENTIRTYVDRIQATVAEWMALWPIFDVSVRETGLREGGEYRCRDGGRTQRRSI